MNRTFSRKAAVKLEELLELWALLTLLLLLPATMVEY